MIKSFRHKGIEAFFQTGARTGVHPGHAARLQVLLTALNVARSPMDMNVAAWRLHKLIGRNPRGRSVDDHWAVAVSGNWRLTFTFEGHDVVLVDYLDYH